MWHISNWEKAKECGCKIDHDRWTLTDRQEDWNSDLTNKSRQLRLYTSWFVSFLSSPSSTMRSFASLSESSPTIGPAMRRGWAETKTETLSKNQNWILLDWDTRNTGIPATISMHKAERIYSSCTFIQKVKGESQSGRKILHAFFLKVVAGMPAFTAS